MRASDKKDLGDNLGVVPMPEGPGGKASPLNGIDGFYVNPNSKNAEGAVNLALFLTSQESSQIYTDKAGHVAIRSDVQAADPLVGAFAVASATGFRRPQSAEFGQLLGPRSATRGPGRSRAPLTRRTAVKAACVAIEQGRRQVSLLFHDHGVTDARQGRIP